MNLVLFGGFSYQNAMSLYQTELMNEGSTSAGHTIVLILHYNPLAYFHIFVFGMVLAVFRRHLVAAATELTTLAPDDPTALRKRILLAPWNYGTSSHADVMVRVMLADRRIVLSLMTSTWYARGCSQAHRWGTWGCS
jgi:hypothetical protein